MGKTVCLIFFVLCGITWANSTTCITRKTCNSTDFEVCYDSHFMLDFDSNGGFEITGHGYCAQCSDLPLEHCFAPCFKEGNGLLLSSHTTCSPDPLSFVLNLDWQIPFYLGGLFGLTKLVFSFVIITPKKVGSTTSKTTIALRALSFLFLTMGFASDLQKVAVAFTDSSMSWWQAVQSIALIWLASSNMPAMAAAFAMMFAKAVNESGIRSSVDLGQKMFSLYINALGFGYFLPGIACAAWCVPSLVLYAWFSIPLMCFARCLGVLLGPIVARMVIGIAGEKHLDDFEEGFKDALKNAIEESEQVPALERMKTQVITSAKLTFAMDPYTAMLDMNKPMETAIVLVLLVPILSIFVTAQARLFDNYGYLEALYLTLTERHVATYLNLARQNSLHLANLIWLIV